MTIVPKTWAQHRRVRHVLAAAMAVAPLLSSPAGAIIVAHYYGVGVKTTTPTSTLYAINTQSPTPSAYSNFSVDGYDAVQANADNGGTAFATSSGDGAAKHTTESYVATVTGFDLPATRHGTLSYRVTGWGSVEGQGTAAVAYLIQDLGKPLVWNEFDVTSGLKHYDKSLRINWQGGDTLVFAIYAATVIDFGQKGLVNAYIDPVATTMIGGVPEPATWLLLIVGFGAVGYASRRRAAAQSVVA